MNPAHIPYTAEQTARLKALHAQGQAPRAIAAQIGRSYQSVIQKLSALRCYERATNGQVADKIIVPQWMLDEREARRAAAARCDVTAAVCGDPPPGYSALDRMKRAA